MSDQAAEAQVPDNALTMSDEEFMKMDPSVFEGEAPAAAAVDATDAGEGDEGDTDPGPDGGSPPDDDVAAQAAKAQADANAAAKAEANRQKDLPADTAKEETPAKEEPPVKETPPAGELTDAQYVEIGKQVMAEFKANGTTIKVKNVEDAIQLMQMGANYHKKMSGLKPSLKALKLLENHGLLDPTKLSYLIDLSQKKPEAITQLLKDSKIDPMNIDLDSANDYVPTQRTVSDTEIQLDEILEQISHSPVYNRTLTVLGEEWDAESRNALAKTPEVIRTINAHMESGIYDQVAAAVAYERSLGKLTGISDYEAYQRVGTYMHENKLFVVATGSQTPPNASAPPAKVPQETAAQIEERKRRKQAASPSRSQQAPDANKATYNPLTMSDEDFAKLNKLNL